MALQNLHISEWNIIRENWVQGRTAAAPFIFFGIEYNESGWQPLLEKTDHAGTAFRQGQAAPLK